LFHGLISLKAFKNLVNSQVSVVGPHNHKQQREQNHADGRAEGPVQRTDDPLENEIGDHVVSRPTQYHGGQIGPGRQHEDQQAAGAETGKAQGKRHLTKRLPFGAAHAACGFEKTLVDAFQADVDIQDHERQQIHDQSHEYRKLIIKHGYGRRYQPDLQQEVVDQSRIAHDVDPAHSTDDETDPKRQHDEQKKSLFITAFAAIEKIGGNIAHDNTENDGLKGDANRSNENFGIEEIFKEFGVIAELECRNICSAGSTQPEAVYNDKTNRYDQKKKDCTQRRRQQRPWFPFVRFHERVSLMNYVKICI